MQCTIDGCSMKVKAAGLCSKHYERKRVGKEGIVGYGEKGSRRLNTQGYWMIGSTLEHVLIMEKKLGRKLIPPEEVHHKDENTQNNDPDNLVLCRDREHHRDLHRRADALKACGNESWLRCRWCGKYSDPQDPDLYINAEGNLFAHRSCSRERMRLRRSRV